MSKSMKFAVALAAAISLSAASAQAQFSTINAKATVLQAITVTGAADLDFGSVLPGVQYVVQASSGANAGRFDLTGVPSANMNISFTLPATLTGPGAPITVSNWSGCWNPTAVGQAGCAGFTPSGGATPTTFNGSGLMSVYLGAEITPASLQTAGLYQGSVRLDAIYF